MKCQFCDEHSYEMEILKKHMKESHAACKLSFYLVTALRPDRLLETPKGRGRGSRPFLYFQFFFRNLSWEVVVPSPKLVRNLPRTTDISLVTDS